MPSPFPPLRVAASPAAAPSSPPRLTPHVSGSSSASDPATKLAAAIPHATVRVDKPDSTQPEAGTEPSKLSRKATLAPTVRTLVGYLCEG